MGMRNWFLGKVPHNSESSTVRQQKMKKILIVYSHPKEGSLNHSIKEAVIRGLKKFDVDVRVQDLYKDKFNPLLRDREENDKDKLIIQMKKNVTWAEWLIFIAPMWWAHVPAMLKGYFDRVFTEDFSFKYNQAGMPVGLLENKKALLVATCDTPPLLLKLSGGTRGLKSVLKGILRLCGIKGSKFKLFGSALKSSKEKRGKWIRKAEKIGENIGKPEGAAVKLKRKLVSLIKAARIRLYSFVFCSILLGAAFGASIDRDFNWFWFAIAAFIGLLAHAAVSLANEVADEDTDKINANRTMFNGGTGLLAKGLITRDALNMGWIISCVTAILIASLLVFVFQFHWVLFFSLTLVLFLGLEYSLPPLRLSRIGLGEIAAFLAYGAPLMIVGLALQVEKSVVNQLIADYRFYLLSLPVSLSVFVTMCLTQIPDTDADKSTGKKSISVLLGPQKVLVIAVIVLSICVSSFVVFFLLKIVSLKYSLIAAILPITTAVIILANLDAYKIPAGIRMINIMGMSVTSTVYCTVVPAIYFLIHSN
jgi:NAD(P)H dehydrogenase (quinone)